jgi:hypothetical protein
MQRAVFDATTGRQYEEDLTPEEEARLLAAREAYAAVAAEAEAQRIPPVDYGSDAPTDYNTQLPTAVSALRNYLTIAPSSVTPIQHESALRLLIRVVLFIIRRSVR